jgi:tetratricopeptide (TPR) repeat protein
MVLPPCLDYIKDFVGGRAECMMQGVIGYIDRNGQVLTPGFCDDVINRSMLTSNVQLRMSILKNLITLKPTYAQAHNNLAACYTSIEKYKDAIPLLKLAHRLDPQDPVIAKNLQKAKDGRNDKILTATFVVVGVVASVALAAVAVVADVASVEGGGGGSYSSGSSGSGSSGSGSSYGSSSSGKSSGSSGVSQSELQSQYDRAIDNIRKIKDSWSDHVGTHAEATNRQNLNEVKQTIRKIKSRASEKGYTLRTDSLENWNP